MVLWSPWMFFTLEQFDHNFTERVKVFYNRSMAAVITNGVRSGMFEVLRGSRQGCQLFPLLLALMIKPFQCDPAMLAKNLIKLLYMLMMFYNLWLFTFLLDHPPQDLCIWAYLLHSSTRCSKPISNLDLLSSSWILSIQTSSSLYPG